MRGERRGLASGSGPPGAIGQISDGKAIVSFTTEMGRSVGRGQLRLKSWIKGNATGSNRNSHGHHRRKRAEEALRE